MSVERIIIAFIVLIIKLLVLLGYPYLQEETKATQQLTIENQFFNELFT